jgi:hypothetical protein
MEHQQAAARYPKERFWANNPYFVHRQEPRKYELLNRDFLPLGRLRGDRQSNEIQDCARTFELADVAATVVALIAVGRSPSNGGYYLYDARSDPMLNLGNLYRYTKCMAVLQLALPKHVAVSSDGANTAGRAALIASRRKRAELECVKHKLFDSADGVFPWDPDFTLTFGPRLPFEGFIG